MALLHKQAGFAGFWPLQHQGFTAEFQNVPDHKMY